MSNSIDAVLGNTMSEESYYDPSLDKPNVMIPEGEYYAHVKEFTVKSDVVVRNKYMSDIYNIVFKLAPENSDKDFGEHSGSLFVGKTVRSKGFFRFKNPNSPNLESNSGGNREFKEVCEALGVSPEEKEVDGKKVFALPSLTPANSEGKPAIIKVKHEDWTNRDGEEMKSPKAYNVFSWSNGKIDVSDLPF
tara:strand:- start:3134 stop:3706 length:573 start_codon:yes stop_codon:yes gene_type:complete